MMSSEEGDDAGSEEKMVIPSLSEKALLATGIRIGTQVRTKNMEQFTTRPRPDGLHLLDYSKTLHRIDVAGKFISFIGPPNVVVYTSRDYGKVPVEKFCEVTKAIPVVGRFMPGTLTNPLFPGHLDVELIVVADPASDTQAIVEAANMGTPVIAVCDTDNITDDIDLVIPGNNRGRRSLATIFYLLARSVLTHSSLLTGDQQLKYTIDDFETKVTESDMEEEEDERPRRHDRF
jgi:small subunit ribosomal protein S2